MQLLRGIPDEEGAAMPRQLVDSLNEMVTRLADEDGRGSAPTG